MQYPKLEGIYSVLTEAHETIDIDSQNQWVKNEKKKFEDIRFRVDL